MVNVTYCNGFVPYLTWAFTAFTILRCFALLGDRHWRIFVTWVQVALCLLLFACVSVRSFYDDIVLTLQTTTVHKLLGKVGLSYRFLAGRRIMLYRWILYGSQYTQRVRILNGLTYQSVYWPATSYVLGVSDIFHYKASAELSSVVHAIGAVAGLSSAAIALAVTLMETRRRLWRLNSSQHHTTLLDVLLRDGMFKSSSVNGDLLNDTRSRQHILPVSLPYYTTIPDRLTLRSQRNPNRWSCSCSNKCTFAH